jgi:enamine deaminase RidA (YjgF/YER057c/UK114 family)
MTGDPILRVPGSARGRSQASAWRDLAWAVATASDKGAGIYEQTRQALDLIDASLAGCGTDRTRIVTATVYIIRMTDKAEMDRAWNEWIGPDPSFWPQRACVGVQLEGGTLVEIVVAAAR